MEFKNLKITLDIRKQIFLYSKLFHKFKKLDCNILIRFVCAKKIIIDIIYSTTADDDYRIIYLVRKNESRQHLEIWFTFKRTTNDNIIVKHSAFAQIVPQGCQYKVYSISISYHVLNIRMVWHVEHMYIMLYKMFKNSCDSSNDQSYKYIQIFL